MRILSVDDKLENRYLMEALLKGHGFEVRSASNGAEALQCMEEEKFDCILSDILMPVMDGFELCRRIKADSRFCRIPFIVFTATYTGPQDEAFALKIGATRFVQKPCEPELLVQTITEVLDGSHTEVPPLCSFPAEEGEVLKLYNERLVRKLEQKMLELEQEVDARKKTEDILCQSETNYRRLFHSIRDALLVSDTHRRIINCNRAFADLFGYSLDELLGESTAIVYESEAQYHHLVESLQTLTDDPSQIFLIQFKTKEGRYFPGEVNLFRLYDDEERMTGYIGLIRDVTQRIEAERQQQQLEAQLRQAQKMESIGRLAGGVAHDYNNMLSVILGYAQMGLSKTKPGLPVHEFLQQIIDAAQRSSAMTRKLLGFARKQAIVPRVIDLNETVGGMLKMLQRMIGEQVQLVWQPQADLWPVLIDPSQVDQILANLCVNARDAMAVGGHIIIRTAMVSLTDLLRLSHGRMPAGEYVLLSISDEGCGIDPTIQEQMFEPFFTTKEEGQGTGLGLSTVYGIMQQNSGFIDVRSAPGQGTNISLYLPRHPDSAEHHQEVEAAILRGGGETILVVDDEEGILRSTSALLSSLGYTVLATTRPTEAILLAHTEPGGIQLLLTDLVMPEMGGEALASLLRSFYPKLKCLFMSGYADDLPGWEKTDGQGQCILKPFPIDELAAKVHAAMHSPS
ncbi:MAG: response regulator [Desulfobulbus sp.]|nr:response regulator [Desulfobulbus sp.]